MLERPGATEGEKELSLRLLPGLLRRCNHKARRRSLRGAASPSAASGEAAARRRALGQGRMRFAVALALAAACAASRAAGAEVRTGAGASLRAHAAESLACGKTGASCTTDSDCCSQNLSTNIYTKCSGNGEYWLCSTSTKECQINFCQES